MTGFGVPTGNGQRRMPDGYTLKTVKVTKTLTVGGGLEEATIALPGTEDNKIKEVYVYIPFGDQGNQAVFRINSKSGDPAATRIWDSFLNDTSFAFLDDPVSVGTGSLYVSLDGKAVRATTAEITVKVFAK